MNNQLGDLASDLLSAAGSGATRIKTTAIAQGRAEATTGASVLYAPAPGLHQALRQASRATGHPGPALIAAHMANSMGDAAVDLLRGT